MNCRRHLAFAAQHWNPGTSRPTGIAPDQNGRRFGQLAVPVWAEVPVRRRVDRAAHASATAKTATTTASIAMVETGIGHLLFKTIFRFSHPTPIHVDLDQTRTRPGLLNTIKRSARSFACARTRS
jgi:hypothetical protein